MIKYPFFLWVALAIIPLAIGGMLWKERQAQLLIKRLGIVEKLINLDTQKRRLSYLMRVGVLVCLLIALARPKWGVAEQVIVAEGIGVIWVLDISRSMDAQDITPSRLERAKLMMNIVMENNPNHQYGGVVFAGNSLMKFPMTMDTLSAQGIVQSITTASIDNQGTNIIRAVEVGLNMLDQRMLAQGIVVILSDGEQNRQFDDLSRVIGDANQRGVPIYTIGYGTHDGAMIPDPEGGFIRDANGEQVISQLEEQLLADIASSTGGAYQISTSTGEEVAFLQRAIDCIGTEEFERRSQLDYVPRFPIFIALALALLLIDGVVRNEKKHPVFDDVSDLGL